MEDPSVAEPERDVVGTQAVAVDDEIAWPLLPAATGPPAASCCHESRGTSRPVARKAMWTRPEQSIPAAVRPPHSYGRRDIAARRERVGRPRPGQLALAVLERLVPTPSRGSRKRSRSSPSRPDLLHLSGSREERLGDLLRIVARLSPDRRERRGDLTLRLEPPQSVAFTSGQSSSVIAYQAESRGPGRQHHVLREIPSNCAPSVSSARECARCGHRS